MKIKDRIVSKSVHNILFFMGYFCVTLFMACTKEIPLKASTDTTLPKEARAILANIKRTEYLSNDSLTHYAQQLSKINDPIVPIYAHYYNLKAKFLKVYNEKAFDEYNSYYQTLEQHGLYHLMAEVDILSTYYDYDFLDFKDAAEHVGRAMKYCFKPELDLERMALIFGISPSALNNTPEEKKEEVLASLNEMEKYPWGFYHSRVYRTLAKVYCILEDYEKATQIVNENIERNLEHSLTFDLSYNYELLAYIEMQSTKDLDKYVEYQHKAIAGKEQYGQKYHSLNYRMLGHHYFNAKQFDKAYQSYFKAVESDKDDINSLCVDNSYLGWAFYKMNPEKNLDKALELFDRALNMADEASTGYRIALERKLWAYQAENRPDTADLKMKLLQLSRQDQIKQSNAQLKDFQMNTILGLKSKNYRLANLKRENDIQEERLKNQKTFKVLSVVMFVMSLTLLGLFVKVRKDLVKKRELNQKLEESVSRIALINKDLEAKNKNIKHLLLLNERTLFSKVLKISTYKDALNTFTGQVSNLIKSGDTISPNKLFPIQKGLRELINEDEIWEDFKVQFEKTRPNFFKNLKNEAPDLSVNELKHCTYVVSRLRTKEVANMINVSPRSVETARYRIKKKLDLNTDDSLYDYLSKIA